jgi:hypothetical protein
MHVPTAEIAIYPTEVNDTQSITYLFSSNDYLQFKKANRAPWETPGFADLTTEPAVTKAQTIDSEPAQLDEDKVAEDIVMAHTNIDAVEYFVPIKVSSKCNCLCSEENTNKATRIG